MLHKRPNSRFWWCDFVAPDGKRIQRSTKTVDRRLAQEYEDKLRYQLWRVIQLGEKPRRTWKEAATRWYRETNRKSKKPILAAFKWLDKYLGDLYLDQVTRDMAEEDWDVITNQPSIRLDPKYYKTMLRAWRKRRTLAVED